MSNSQRKILSIFGVVVILAVILPYSLQYGFCREWWLKDRVWAHYLWLCTCGIQFEQSLYQENVEVVVSACRDPQKVRLSTDGQYMVISTRINDHWESFILNLMTGQEKPWPYHIFPGASAEGFWTDTLYLIDPRPGVPYKLVDITDYRELPLDVFVLTPKGSVFDLEIPPLALQGLEEAKQILIHRSEPAILAIGDRQQDGTSYLLTYSASHPKFRESIEETLARNNIAFDYLTTGWSGAYFP